MDIMILFQFKQNKSLSIDISTYIYMGLYVYIGGRNISELRYLDSSILLVKAIMI